MFAADCALAVTVGSGAGGGVGPDFLPISTTPRFHSKRRRDIIGGMIICDDRSRGRFSRLFTRGASGECWEWSGAIIPTGYGRFNAVTHRGRQAVPAHRFAYVSANGPIDGGLVVRHRCDNRRCVNPTHLELGSQADNLADMVKRGRAKKARGEMAGKAKLTADDVREIRRRASAGERHPPIARDFGVHTASVWAIVHRHHWAHVD